MPKSIKGKTMNGLLLRVPAAGKHAVLLACALAWHPIAIAADVLPPHLAGTWATAQSLYDGETAQAEIHLQPDGFGIMAGSAPPARRLDGKDDGKPALRAVAGFALRATVDGNTLTVRPISLDPAKENKARRSTIICSFEEAGPTLTCAASGRPPVVLKQRSETVPEETARVIEEVRSRAR